MKSLPVSCPKWLLPLGLLLTVAGCREKDPPEPPALPRHNSFAMTLNGAAWQPSQLGPDTCARTYYAKWGEVHTPRGRMPYYTLFAYQDPQGAATPKSANVFTLQFTEVLTPGSYPIEGNGLFDPDFENYAIFTVNRADGTASHYVNRQARPNFRVEVSEFFPFTAALTSNELHRGVKGTFQGTLYNAANPKDSLTISKGAFTIMLFNTNVPGYDQCR